MANVALVTFGSAGDVHPMLALGRGLQAAGHRVLLLTNPAFAGEAAKAGIELLPVGQADDYQRTVAHARLWHPVDGLGVMWRYLLRPALEPTFDALAGLAKAGRWTLLANPVAMGARVAHEALGLPLISAYTAATMLRTVHDPMTLAQWRVPPRFPRVLRAAAWRLLDRHKLQPMARPAIDALRRRAGLPPVAGSIFGAWMHSPQAGVALFPGWFAPVQPDWPAAIVQTGFPLYDGDAGPGLPPGVADFLAAGPPPVVFMPGTAAGDRPFFYESAVRACAATGRRGLLLGRVEPALAARLPASVRAAPYAPFARLLPLSAALVHHGGIGSCAQALRAGVPQLVLPQAYDQFDNAMRVDSLGVGATLLARPQARGAADAMGRALSQVLAGDAPGRAAALAPRVTPDEAHRVVARLVAGLA